MIRDIQLLNHLPLFVQEYKEIMEIMKTENPEFQSAVDETEIIMNNQFIESCDIKGIARFENLMGITPESNDTLESRISRVLTRWNDVVPYTYIILCRKLNTLCGKDNYEIERNINEYKMDITTHLELPGQTEELDYLLDYMMPVNIVVTSKNIMNLNMEDGTTKLASGITFCNLIELTDNFKENFEITGDSKVAGAVVNTVSIEISDNFNETFNIEGETKIGSNINVTEII
jgi:hypothetical protein